MKNEIFSLIDKYKLINQIDFTLTKEYIQLTVTSKTDKISKQFDLKNLNLDSFEKVLQGV